MLYKSSGKRQGLPEPRFENQLWKKFREPIDAFFAAKDGHFAEKDEANAENLKAKQTLIDDLQKLSLDADPKKAINQLRDVSKAFAEIGNVPFADKDKIYKDYKKALDEKYDSIKMDKEEKEKMLFQAKLDTIMGSDNQEKMVDQERRAIRSKIEELNKEILQLETNLAFFANADENNPLFKNVKTNMERANNEIDSQKLRLKLIREALK